MKKNELIKDIKIPNKKYIIAAFAFNGVSHNRESSVKKKLEGNCEIYRELICSLDSHPTFGG